MITDLLFALSVVASGPQEATKPLVIPVLEGATASPDCRGYTDENFSVFCVTTENADAQSVATRYVEWFRAQGFEVAPAPEADAGFFRAPCDAGLLNIERLIDERYRMTRLFVFRIADPTSCAVPATMDGSGDSGPT